MHSNCNACHAACCRYACVPLLKPDSYEQFEDIRWYLLHEGISVHIDLAGDWWMMIDNRCKMLRETHRGSRCADYDRRPLACRRLSPKNCHVVRGGFDCEELFRTADDLDAYAHRMLGEAGYEKARRHLAPKPARRRPAKPAAGKAKKPRRTKR